MSTKTDNKKLYSYYYYATFLALANLGQSFGVIKFLQFLDPMTPISNRLKNSIPIGFVTFGIIFSFYKIQMLKYELDEKYTPLWLKSSGSSMN